MLHRHRHGLRHVRPLDHALTLGDLHRAIQVLFDWDGDHLHAFTVAGLRYSDPLFDLEETADEEAVRLRDAFPASARSTVRRRNRAMRAERANSRCSNILSNCRRTAESVTEGWLEDCTGF